AADKAALVIGYATGDSATGVTQDVTLPTAGTNGTTVTWASNRLAVVAADGTVTRPTFTQGNQSAKLTATIERNGVSDTREFSIEVLAAAQTDAEAVAADKAALVIGYATGDSATGVTQDVTLPTAGTNGTTVTWASNRLAVVAADGTITRPTFTQGNQSVKLTATIERNGVSDTREFPIEVLAAAQTDAEAVAADKAALVIGYATGDSATGVTQDVTLPTAGTNETEITWSSDKDAIISDKGIVVRPSYLEGPQDVVLTATIAKGTVSDVRTFTIKVLPQTQTDQEAVAAAKAALAITFAQGDSEASVTQDVTLPAAGVDGTTITWSSNDDTIITNEGHVERPVYTASDIPVTLTATIAKNGVQDTRTFTLTVLKQDAPALLSITATPAVLNLDIGAAAAPTLTGDYGIAGSKSLAASSLSWVVANPQIAEVNAAGLVTALQAGATTVTGTLDGITVTIPVTVSGQVAVRSIEVDAASLDMSNGSVRQLRVAGTLVTSQTVDLTQSATYVSSATSVATVSTTGLVTAVSSGTATITVTFGTFQKTVNVTVTVPSIPTVPPVPTPTEPVKPTTPQEPTPAPESGDVFKSEIVNTKEVVSAMAAKVEAAKKNPAPNQPADIKGHWAEKTVQTLTNLGAITGYADGTIRPNSDITRAEFVTIISRIFTISASRTPVALNDISDHWAKPAIEALAGAGVIQGYGNGSFKPNNTITREEMVAIMSRLIDMEHVAKDTTKGNFTDTSRSFAADAIKQSAEAGIINGKANDKFDPKSNATRAEALTLILNTLNLNPDIKMLLESLN
ncbi:immunoglobulin-like domain-containing protein, partial [Cohnella sp. 56]|uniref:immunoglobulin-like domain-containing protein n=1 Tax=Cohnella sp. 56 TaxID=3113722 RepID=UPI0030E9F513